MQAATLIARYCPEPHPEGGYCRETRRSDTVIAHEALSERFSGQRHCLSAILLQPGNRDVSRLHRIRSDEIGYLIGHFYDGGSLRPAMVFPDGTASEVVPGQDIEAGQYVQHVVPAGVRFGAKPCAGTGFSFVGCTVSPGIDFADFGPSEKPRLLQTFPQAHATIREFCP